MKKLTVLLALALVLVFTMGTSAQEFSAENMKFVGGLTYNTYDGTFSGEGSPTVDNGDKLPVPFMSNEFLTHKLRFILSEIFKPAPPFISNPFSTNKFTVIDSVSSGSGV